jgi:uracil-DNA glycosylase
MCMCILEQRTPWLAKRAKLGQGKQVLVLGGFPAKVVMYILPFKD